ncbi:MAG: Ig-like domain-containing protein [Treponema sp.]|nr:Ig-like domain-containing protein [Treponema sp.]MEE3434104.1 Ig-like domain-containing protein [Treponema sp.]
MTINRKMKKSEFFSVHSLFAGLFGALALFFAFSSCDVGLGESIDTSVPTVSITEPASSSSVSGNFVISGVANDDKSLDKVVLTIKNTATGATTTQTTKITGKNWSVVLDKLNFKDGTYSVDVVAYDGAGRVSGTASRVFDVDNTPPVFCVTKPNSITIEDPAAYGRDVTIKGEIADDHAVKQMEIRVFKKDASGLYSEITNSLAKTTFEGFETAGGTEVTIAKYFPDADIPPTSSEDYVLYQNYMAMYDGATMGDTVSLYIFPYLTDAAGNVSDKCYIQSSLKQLIAEVCGISVISDSLQTAQLKKILNGSYNLSDLDDDDIENVKKILDGTYDQSGLSKVYKYFASLPEDSSEIGSSSPLAMSVNANNSPMYEFGGYVFDKDDPEFAEVSSGGNASIKVTAGLDGNEVVANTIRAYFYLCDDTGDKEESEPAYSSDNADPNKRFDIKDGSGTLVQNLPDSTRVSNATYNITLPNNLAAGLHYLMEATGEDTAGNKLYSVAKYAFMVAVTGDAPKVEFDDQFFINANAIDKTKSLAYSAKINIVDKSGNDGKGTIKEAGNWVKVTPILYKGYAKTKGYLKDDDILEVLPTIKYETSAITKVADGAYSVSVEMNKFDLSGEHLEDNYTVALKVQAKSQGATSEETTYIFWADKAAPALAISAPARAEGQSESDPIYIFENDKNITATTTAGVTSYAYKMSGTWSDLSGSGTSEIWYRWDNGSAIIPPPSVTWTAATGTAAADKTYYNKQGEGLYLAETGIAMGASVSGMYTASISGWTAIAAAPKSVSRANWNQSDAKTNSSGQKLRVVAIDQTGNLSQVATVSNITFDFAPPAITIPTIKEYYKKSDATSGKYQFTIDINDASGIKSLTANAYINGGTTPINASSNPYGYSLAISDDKTSATITLVDTGASDGKWRFETIASDTADRSSQKEFAFTIDTVAPERVNHYTDSDPAKCRMITIGESGSVNDWFNSENLTIKGRFKEMTSGLDKVDYTLIPAGETTGVSGTEVIGGTVGEDIAYAISPVGFKEGLNSVSIIASDLAGNLSSQSDYTIQVDVTAPSVETAWYTYDGDSFNAATGNVMANGTDAGAKAMTVYGTVSESLSGLKDLALTINGTAVSSSVQFTKDDLTAGTADVYKNAAWADYAAADNKAYTGFKATIPASTFKTLPSGSVDLYALAHDIAANETKQRKFGISLDNDAPVITIMSPQADSSVNGTVAFSGIVDDNALNEVKGYWSLNDDPTKLDNDSGLTGTSNWSLSLATSSVDAANKKISFVDGTEYSGTPKDFYLKIYASDKAANSDVKVQKYTIDPQKDRPVITLTTAKLSGMEDGKPVWFESTKIEGTIEDDDGVDEFSYSIDAGANWNPITVTGGSWIADLQNDNEYTILFKVKDKAGTEFVSVKSDGADKYLAPVLVGTDSRFDGGDTRLYLKVDTKRPEFENLVYKVSDAAAGTYDWADSSDHKKLGTVGGQRKFIQLEFDAKDANGIESVKATINGVPYDGTVGELTSGVYPCVITGIDVSVLESEAYSLSLEIKGTYDADVTTEPLPVIVDNTAPAVTKISPDLNTVHGNITVYGTVDYAKEIKYALGLSPDKANKPADTDYDDIAGAGMTWFLYFDGADSTMTESHHKTFEYYIINQKIKQTKEYKKESGKVKIDGIEVEVSDANGVKLLDDKYVELTATDYTINTKHVFDDVAKIYVWIKAVDDVGNVYEEPQLVNFDPQGGRPTFTYSNPEKDQARIGGQVKLYGGVDDDEGVTAAFLQIISKQHTWTGYSGGTDFGTVEYNADGSVKAFNLKANDLDYLQQVGYTVVNRNTYTPTSSDAWAGSGDPNDYGVLLEIKGGTTWNLTINEKDEFNPSGATEETKTNALAVCGYAYDGAKFNWPQYRAMVVDADSPRISGQYLKQYEGSSLQAKASREYSEGIYVSGKWTLEFDLTDGDSIKKIYVGQSDSKADDAKAAAETERENDTTPADHLVKPSWCYVKTGSIESGYHAKLDGMTPASGVGSKYLYVLFADEKGNYSNYAFAVHYDNVNPVIDASKLDISTDIHNSNGYYSIGASVTENTYDNKNQSGFDKFVVYFKRGSKIYDPMVSKKIGGVENPDNWADVSSLTPAADGLYWFDQELETRDATNLNVLTLKAKNGNIHAGGLVKIGGAIYVIKSLSSDGLNVTLDSQIEASYTEAQFAYGLVVDNTKQEIGSGIKTGEGYGYGYPDSIMNTDSDCMEEYAHIQGTACNLTAKINSKNIPDGKIDVFYTAYDKAGNYSSGSVGDAYVSNNAPRLANVTVKSDFNYDTEYDGDYETQKLYKDRSQEEGSETKITWEDAEKEVFFGDFDADGNPVRAWIAAKGDVILVPEVMGGNGAIKWNCLYAGSSTPSADQTISTDTPTEENEDRKVNDIVLPAASLKTATAGLGKYVVNILDSTDGGAQKAVINLCMTNDVNDSVKPAAKTKRFYWKSLADNSVYTTKAGGAESLDDLQGHIELDDKPSVSGKVVFKGTAFDNAGIAKINLTIPGFGLSAATAATCDFTKPLATRWTQSSLGDLAADGYHFALDTDEGGNVKERYNNAGHFVSWTLVLDTEKYNGGTAPAARDIEFVLAVTDKNAKASEKASAATTVYATAKQAQKGKYYAEARFAKDDSKSSSYSDANYSSDEFSVIGTAQSSEVSGVYKYSVTPVAANYTMDIVPYITRVKTSLSAVNAKNGVTDRSSLGAYPVYVYKNSTLTGITDSVTKKNEDVEIYGFNLAGAKYDGTVLPYADGHVTLNSENIKQGAFELTVDGIATVNNSNDNDAHGSYTGTNIDDEGELIKKGGDYDVYKNYYNRQPNNANNNNLTDDIAFDVWQLNAYAAAPMYGNVENPQMKIQPFGKTVTKQKKLNNDVGEGSSFTPEGGGTVTTDGKIGFAFANASSAFSMPNSDHSWTYWNYGYTNFRHTALAYDPAGYAWASVAGQDVNNKGNSDCFYLETTHWRENGGAGTGGTHYTWDTKVHAACKLENLAVSDGATFLDRIQSPSIAATTHGLYMAYFDKQKGTIRYRAGAMTGTWATDWNSVGYKSKLGYPGGDNNNTRYWEFKNGFFKNQAVSDNMSYNDSTKYVQIVGSVSGISGNVCIAAIDGGATRANDVAVMVWCDGSKVSYAYTSGDPMASTNNKLTATWTTVDDIFGGKVKGGDCKCQIAVDSAKGVHIAAYDEKNSDIWYAYLEDYNNPDNAKVCKVDSYNSTGEYLTIDVALDESNNPIPQIGYYSAGSSRPKFARWNAAKGSIKTLDADKMQGADEYNSYTGNWEVTNVPTQSAVRVSDEANKVKQNINVGVWKDAAGKLAYSTKNGSATGAIGTSDCHVASGMNTTGNYGDVYGNGTRNAVLGYMWGDSADAFIETAQRMD